MFKSTLIFLCMGAASFASAKTLLFVPGYYGTQLVEKDSQKEVWASFSEILLGTKTLCLPVPGLNLKNILEISPGPILESVRVIPEIYSIGAYDQAVAALKKFSKKNNINFVTFNYDWRKDLIESAALLDDKINSLKQAQPEKNTEEEIYIVSHSLGSLLTTYYLRYGAQAPETAVENWAGLKKIKKAVITAAPYRGTMVLFRNMRSGVAFGFNTQLLSPMALSSFPSDYYLLPPEGFDLALTPDMKDVALHLHDPQNWQNNHWGLFQKEFHIQEVQPNATFNFYKFILNRTQKFSDLLSAPISVAPPSVPLMYLYSSGFQTIEKGIYSDEEKQVYFYNDDLKKHFKNISEKVNYVDGDETLPNYSLAPLPFLTELRAKIVQLKLSHLDLVSDESGQKQIQDFLQGL